jgi:hypothetical protein
MAMVGQHRVDLSPLVTHHFRLDQIDEAFDVFSRQRDGVLKVALHPSTHVDRIPWLAGERALDPVC